MRHKELIIIVVVVIVVDDDDGGGRGDDDDDDDTVIIAVVVEDVDKCIFIIHLQIVCCFSNFIFINLYIHL